MKVLLLPARQYRKENIKGSLIFGKIVLHRQVQLMITVKVPA
jgi:hypothetical protein